MMTAEKAAALGLTPRARVVDTCLVGVDPVLMLTGPDRRHPAPARPHGHDDRRHRRRRDQRGVRLGRPRPGSAELGADLEHASTPTAAPSPSATRSAAPVPSWSPRPCTSSSGPTRPRRSSPCAAAAASAPAPSSSASDLTTPAGPQRPPTSGLRPPQPCLAGPVAGIGRGGPRGRWASPLRGRRPWPGLAARRRSPEHVPPRPPEAPMTTAARPPEPAARRPGEPDPAPARYGCRSSRLRSCRTPAGEAGCCPGRSGWWWRWAWRSLWRSRSGPGAGCSARGAARPPTRPGRPSSSGSSTATRWSPRCRAREERVRLIGIDTPETVAPDRPVECFGAEASHRLSELLPPGTTIRLERDVETA